MLYNQTGENMYASESEGVRERSILLSEKSAESLVCIILCSMYDTRFSIRLYKLYGNNSWQPPARRRRVEEGLTFWDCSNSNHTLTSVYSSLLQTQLAT